LQAAEELAKAGISAEVLDLRSLMPWDYEAVMNSVAKTGRAVLIADAPRHASFVSEVAATIAEEILDMLLAPPIRVTGFDTPYPYAQDKLYMPTVTRILNAAKRALDYVARGQMRSCSWWKRTEEGVYVARALGHSHLHRG
jgi:2-oxoisovalerate dehydrogenase E1 component beta subunit